MARYLTTTLPYANAELHIGHALEFVQADALVRAWRLNGEKVFFTTGSDEHGQKIFETAAKADKDVRAYVTELSEKVQALTKPLGLSEHAFIRTTDHAHYTAAQEMWRRCDAAGDIYKKAYSGLYCVGCELFKSEKDLDETGHCVLHPNLTPETITEENYFFRLSKYQDALLEYLSRKDSIVPDWRREEALNFVKGGLEDFSISREKARLSWGIPVPGDDSQVMYVWFDALTSYLSTLGWPADLDENFSKYWENGTVVQMAGKDQVRFQSIMWQAMLMSAKVKNTDQVFYHGFITSGGQKMSKSLGNVISPNELVEKYGTDATRYMLLRHVHPVEDSDVTWERLDEWYTANLVNGLGNLVARVMKLAEEHLGAPILFTSADAETDPTFMEKIESYQFNEAIDMIFALVAKGDEFMTAREPFRKIKIPELADIARGDIDTLVRNLARIALYLVPFMPTTAAIILRAVEENKKPENLFPRLT
jgi:methionyl-tRNA synthetase